MKKKIVGLITALCLVFTMGIMLTACKTPDAPETATGEIYRTSVVKANANVSAYLSFKDYGEGENEWGAVGKVYELTVSSYGGNFGMWSDGYWTLDGNTLTLTPKDQDDKTCLTDSMKDEAKTYTATDGVFSIAAKAGGANVTFTLNPTTDKVGEDTKDPCVTHVDENSDGKCDVCGEDMPKAPCTTHVDENNDGKCDVCGEDMPTEAQLQLELVAKTSVEIPSVMTINADASLKLYSDNTWQMDIKTDANPQATGYEKAASGTWALNQDYSMTLTVAEQTNENSITGNITVTCDASGYPDLVYASTVAYVSNGLTFNFAFALPTVEAKTPVVTLTAQDSVPMYQGGPNVTADAKIELYDDNTWVMFVKTDADPTNTEYVEAASGTYTNTQTSMTLTPTKQTAENSLTGNIEVAVGLSQDYTTINYTATVAFTSYFTFNFNFTGSMPLSAA